MSGGSLRDRRDPALQHERRSEGLTRSVDDAGVRAAAVARDAYGKLVAILAVRTGDIAAAEDALSHAFLRALETWPRDFPDAGAPANPEGWLVATARNHQRDRAKSAAERRRAPEEAAGAIEDPVTAAALAQLDDGAPPDRRLSLMFVCAHPAIDSSVRTPLMLQTVLGLDASDIATVFLVPSSAMAQRLVRAKRKIKDARIPFDVPDRSVLASRIDDVLEAIYGAHAFERLGRRKGDEDLSDEALFLSDIALRLLPEEPEPLGLGALLSFEAARRSAAIDDDGVLTPISEQDVGQWDEGHLQRGDALLARAHVLRRPGRFQIEAAIQSAHCDRRRTGRTDWPAIVQLYEGLLALAPTVGAAVARAAAVGEAYGAEAGLKALETIDPETAERFQPALATRAHLLSVRGDNTEARRVYDAAIALTTDAPSRRFLEQRRDRLRD